MKNKKYLLFITVCLLLYVSGINSQTPYYYYYKGKKQYFELDRSRIFVSVADTTQIDMLSVVRKSAFKQDIPADRQIKQNYKTRYWRELIFQDNLSSNHYENQIASLKQNNINTIVAPFFINKRGKRAGLSNFLYVKLKSLSDTVILKQQAVNHNAIIVGQDEFMPLWFTVSVTPASSLNAMELSNIFYKSGLFRSAEPDLMVENALACASDTYFNHQWGLKNTGQYGGISETDIKVCDAWQYSTGKNIVVAVVDEGIDMEHPDLTDNMYYKSYDISLDKVPQTDYIGYHGTPCAGILAASKNDIGITGVAPDSKIMSISTDFAGYETLDKQKLAKGINWAWQNGADIISNSWSADELSGEYITDAIDSATTFGRNGLGCIVVFATHNYNSSVCYPATLPNVFAVGAMSPCGERKSPLSCDGEDWGSNFGEELDIVAPGELISTTDVQGNIGYNYVTNDQKKSAYSDYTNKDYTGKFGGTSAATPMVAGVAALVLSANPYLTEKQVRDIIENTAQKVRTDLYTYSSNSAHPNGTWHEEMGYGLVDAFAAVQAACPTIITDQTITANRAVNSCCEIEISNTTIEPGANVTITSSKQIRLLPGFHAKEGSRFHAKIESCESTSGAAPSLVRERNVFDSQDVIPEEDPKPVNIISEIEIYPNPAGSTVTVIAGTAKINRIKISNSLGITVLSVNTDNTSSADIDISALAKGIYFVSIFTENNKLHSSKIIKK